ncbi:MAG: Gfo/Idh/MocA family protein, partial [Nakamurella sp.]
MTTGPLGIGIGIVGAGFIAESHAQAIAGHPGLRLAAVYDRNPAAAAALAVKYGGTVLPELDDLLADESVDVVVLGTPNDTHAELALATAAAGKHLLLEKPLTLTVADAQQVVDAFADNGLTLLVGHTHRHSDYARAVSDALRSGAVGTPRSMRIAITAGWLWGNWGAWVLDPARSGGHAFHNGVHLYDLARWWMDSPVERVFTIGQKVTAAALQIDDALVATLEFANGTHAVCEISRGERPKTTN